MTRLRLLALALAGPLLLSACDEPSGPRAPADLAPAGGDAQSGTVGVALANPLVVRVTSAGGNPVRGAVVAWRADPGSGTVTAAAAETDADGRVSATWLLGAAAGPQRAVALIEGVDSVVFTATAAAGAPAAVTVVSGNGQNAQVGQTLPQELVVLVRDAHGNPVPGAVVRWRATAGGGSVAPAETPASATGTASARWTLGTVVGEQSAVAEVGALAPATFTASSGFSSNLVVQSPIVGERAGDALTVVVAATSAQEITSVTAAVETRVISLTFSGGRWRGEVPLTGFARGPKQLTVTARDAGGATYVATVPFVLDRRPVVTLTAPVAGTVARPTVRVTATCQDDHPNGCASLTVSTGVVGVLVSAQGGQLDATVSLAPLDGRRVTLQVTGTDSVGQVAIREVRVFVEASPRWAEVASAGTEIWDVSADRVLFLDSAGALKIRGRSGGAETTVDVPAGRAPEYGYLTPRGAIFATSGSPVFRQVHEWRDGVRVDLGELNASQSLEMEGQWAIWNNGATLIRRDLSAGTNVVVSTSAGNTDNDVAAGGDVAFWNTSYDIVRYRGGTLTPLTSDADAVVWNVYPVTDGINTVYTKQTPCCQNQTYRIAMHGAAGEVILTPATTTALPGPGAGYQASGGWVAYLKPGPSGVRQVWLRSPSGDERQITTAGTDSRVDALGPNGELSFITGDRRYAVLPGGAPVDVGNEWAVPRSRALWIDGALYVILGRSVFRVQI